MADTSTKFGVSREILTQNQGRVRPLQASAIPRIQFSTGSAKALQDFSFDMFNASSRIESQLDEQARSEATVEGAAAGATGNFEVQDYNTIRSRAYNQAGIQSFVSTLETKSILQMSLFQKQYANDPEGLNNAWTLYSQGVAEEIDNVSPGAGVMYRQRQLVRGLPSVEAARDNAYRLTKDQAEASLVQSQVALAAEIRNNATDLFSENPARSQAAANSIGIVRQEIMRVYNATGPSGQPLYSATERAKAMLKFNDDVMSSATLSWFDQHEDKAAAYLEFSSGEFSINLETSPAQIDIRDATGGKIRDMPLAQDVQDRLATAVTAVDPSLGVMLVSGGQVDAGTARKEAIDKLEAADVEITEDTIAAEVAKVRTGSERHDHGEAGDIVLTRNGEPVTPDQDPELYARFLQSAAAAGFKGIGHYSWGVHVGGGSVAAWGPDTTGATLDPEFGAAIARGRSNQIDTKGGIEAVSVSDAMSPAAFSAMDKEMRAQINFNNAQADRQDRQEQAEIDTRQDLNAFNLANRLYAGGLPDEDGNVIPPLTRADVTRAIESQELTPIQGRAMIKAMTVDKPKVSDRPTYDEALRRLYSGENIYGFVVNNSGLLSAGDASSLLGKNQSLNVTGEGTLSRNDQFQFDNLKDRLTPDGLMATIDPSADARKFSALDEFRLRVSEGEDSREVAAEISERSVRDLQAITNTKLDALVFPRFHVPSPTENGRVDINKSAKSLIAARDANKITEASYRRQIALLRKWDTLQQGLR